MSISDKKMAVFRQLTQETEPIGLPPLLAKLGAEFKERSVRRWLRELMHDGAVATVGQKRGTKYFAIKQEQGEGAACFSSPSMEVMRAIQKPLFERLPSSYNEKWLDAYRPGVDYYLSAPLRKKLLIAGQRKHPGDPLGTYARHIFNRLMIDLSYNSSRLEGNTYSLLDTERLLLHGDVAEGKMDGEKVMILNHKEAIRYLVENAPTLELSDALLRTLHYLLSDALLEPNESGKVRRHGVRIGGSTYLPIEGTNRLEKLLQKITTKASSIPDPFEQSLFLLIHISYLQAFADVNKRTARLAANIPLIKHNLVPLAFSDIDPSDYLSAMIAIYELQDVRPIVDIYDYTYRRTCAAYDSTIQSLGFDEIRVRFRRERRALLREIIINNLSKQASEKYILEEAKSQVPDDAVNDFCEDVREDLELMDETRLAGLGVTLEELTAWKNNYR